MTKSEWFQLGALIVQFGGVVVSFSVIIRGIVTTIRDWRGSPELIAITNQLETSNNLLKDSNNQMKSDNDRLHGLIERMMEDSEERG
jgi:hypothetical protein